MNSFATLTEWSDALQTKKISAVETVDYFGERIERLDPTLNSFITVDRERARQEALKIDADRARGGIISKLAGLPFGVKDAIDTEGIRSTGAAKILDTFVPTFDATVVKKLRASGAIIIGKQNCDAFGHGGSNENSMYGAVKNPWDISRVAGGSSGGSAVGVAADLCAFSIGEDTGGSVRAPASFCGVSGLKVSYGRTSRYGAMPMASSLDTVGPFAQTAEDLALILEHIAGPDPLDATSSYTPVQKYTEEIKKDIRGLKIGVPAEYFLDTLDDAINDAVVTALEALKSQGAILVPVSMPHTKYAIAAYYIIVPCEDSSNLARLDGIRYGVRRGESEMLSLYAQSRTEGFPTEVKRRIMLGTFALSHGYYDDYYLQAQKVRTLIKRDFDTVFEKVDILATPTAPEIAFKLGDKTSDPLKMYLSDAFVTPASLAGVCALSVPCGFVEGMPVGLQLMGPRMREELPLRAGHHFQQITSWHTHHPSL